MIVLGIETSCDETAAAIVEAGEGGRPRIRASLVASQIALHEPFGGVVPELAARAHVEQLDVLVGRAMAEAELGFGDLDAVAATVGPGLVGGLLVGATMGRAIAEVHGLPCLGINHLEGHALSIRLVEEVGFPFLLLLVSGGHCQLLAVEGPGAYRRYGTTMDDAAGEAFDKGAKLLGLGYPGGPAIEAAARGGQARAAALPRPLLGRPGADFSFSGLKTALAEAAREAPLDAKRVADLSAALQAAIADCLADRAANAMARFASDFPEAEAALVVAGGVAANREVRARLAAAAGARGFGLFAPPLNLCTDNAAMIAWAGIERLAAGLGEGAELPVRPRWPLDERATPLEVTPGRKGARA